ncbi:unnamed protein product [Prorocentrum cordatum]|uniref:Uncharacterized protein n=1 Tax=Prorocentrum cordatum TaxID=2364126 RepID=A0ABN9WHA4_9DINO|nr:unnamed protein product [Polarella glacialis]
MLMQEAEQVDDVRAMKVMVDLYNTTPVQDMRSTQNPRALGDSDREEQAKKYSKKQWDNYNFWKKIMEGGHVVNTSGAAGNPAAGRWARAVAADKNMSKQCAAKKEEGPDALAAFRAEWAEKQWAKYSHMQKKETSLVKRKLKKASYLPIGRVAWLEGGGKLGWIQATRYFTKCIRMGPPWVKFNKMTEVIMRLYGEESIEEEFVEAWSHHQTWFDAEVLSDGEAKRQAQQQMQTAQVAADFAASFAVNDVTVAMGAPQQPQAVQAAAAGGAKPTTGLQTTLEGLEGQVAGAAAGSSGPAPAPAAAAVAAGGGQGAAALPAAAASAAGAEEAAPDGKRKGIEQLEQSPGTRRRISSKSADDKANEGPGTDGEKQLFKDAKAALALFGQATSPAATLQSPIERGDAWKWAQDDKHFKLLKQDRWFEP